MAVRSGLLEQIEAGALDSKAPLSDTLRKCVALGGRSGSAELRDWARKELEGYLADDLLPDYRLVPSPILIDGFTFGAQITGQQIAPSSIPDYASEVIKPEATLTMGIAVLERMALNDKAVQLQHGGMADLVRLMNHDNESNYDQITQMYWKVQPEVIAGVVDHVRTSLVALVAEMRAAGVSDEAELSSDAATQAVNVVIHNQRRSPVVINSALSAPGGSASVATSSGQSESRIPVWIRGPWAVAVGISGIVAAVAGVGGALAAGWKPF